MRIKKLSTLFVLASVLSTGTAVAEEASDGIATDGAQTEQQRPDREKNREKMGDRRKNMTDEERQAAQDARKKSRERWNNMSEEDRQAARDKIRDRRKGKHPKGDRPQGKRPEKADAPADTETDEV